MIIAWDRGKVQLFSCRVCGDGIYFFAGGFAGGSLRDFLLWKRGLFDRLPGGALLSVSTESKQRTTRALPWTYQGTPLDPTAKFRRSPLWVNPRTCSMWKGFVLPLGGCLVAAHFLQLAL